MRKHIRTNLYSFSCYWSKKHIDSKWFYFCECFSKSWKIYKQFSVVPYYGSRMLKLDRSER